MSTSLTVQTVRYLNPLPELATSVQSVGGALLQARRSGWDGDVVLAHGDASPSPLGSADLDVLKRLGDQYGFDYSYTYFNENTGSARGQNLLAQDHAATWQLVTNPDVVFGGSALRELWQRTSDATIGIVEARQLPLELPKYYNPVTGDTSWACGMGSLVRGELWRQIGGYDEESFFLYCDDVDMSWRARLAGYRVVHVPTARIFHDKRLGSKYVVDVPDHETYYSALASYLMARKWGEEADVAEVHRRIVGAEFDSVRLEIARLEASGHVPEKITGASTVAQIADDGTFGSSRF